MSARPEARRGKGWPATQARVPRRRPRGLSLVEMVISITLIGMLAVMAAPMLRLPLAAWSEATRRSDLVQAAEVINSQLALDLQRALPGSARVRTAGARVLLEFLQVRAYGRHRAGPSGVAQQCPAPCAAAGNNDALEAGCAEACFTTLGALEGDAPVVGADWIVVNPLGPGVANGDPWFGGNAAVAGGIKVRLTALQPVPEGMRLRHAAHTFAALAPSRRFFVVAAPVTWDCNPGTGTITRATGYPIAAVQPLAFAAASASAVLDNGVAACAFVVTPGGGSASGTVAARVQLVRAAPGGAEVERFELVTQYALPEGQ